jgi:hypothetical protein
VKYKQEEFTIVSMKDAIAAKPDIAIFSAGGGTSLEFAPFLLKQEQQLSTILQHGEWILIKN